MITTISGINFKSSTQQINSKNNLRLNSLQKDTFELQKKLNPAFGSVIPENEILKISNQCLKDIKNISNIKKLREVSNNFFDKELKRVLEPEDFPPFEPLKFSDNDKDFFKGFRHELANSIRHRVMLINDSYSTSARTLIQEKYPEIVTDKQCLSYLKKEFRGVIKDIKQTMSTWNLLEHWYKNPKEEVPFQDVLNLIKKIPKNKKITPSWDEFVMLTDKQVKKPTVLYQLLSQPLLNAIKYGEGKPFQIKIEEVVSDGKKSYYALFINPETKPIPDNEIDKILEGYRYRTLNARNSKIEGSGFGFSKLISLVLTRGSCEDVVNLIEKGREKGVCVRVPLFGIQ